MAAWIKPLLLALLAALCLHALGLVGIGSQMRASASVLQEQNDPLFTRTIEAASAPAPAAAPEPAPEPPARKATSSIITEQKTTPPKPTETLALEPTQTAVITPTDSIGDLLLTPARPPDSQTAAETATETTAAITPSISPTQSITSKPAGSTDTLLVTGQWPGDTRVSYQLSGFWFNDLHGSGQVQWTRSGKSNENYQVKVIANVPGLYTLSMTSQGKVSPQGLLPEVFEEMHDRTGSKLRIRPLRLEATELLLDGGKRVPRPAEQPLEVQDAVSQFIDLGHRFQQGRAKLETGQVIAIWLGRPGGLDQWIYDVGAEESITLPRIGPVSVFPLKPRPLVNPRGTISMTMWLAPNLQYLPAKIRFEVGPQAHVELLAERLDQR
jgi:hypothetical protein